MRYVIASLALAGIGVSFLALGEHYNGCAALTYFVADLQTPQRQLYLCK